MNRRFAVAVVALCMPALACNLGPFWIPTVTPSPTATSIPTLKPPPADTPLPVDTLPPTDTPTTTATATAIETLTPTAVTCPKGTILHPSVNQCFYASRTPKPNRSFCLTYHRASDCLSNGCRWDKKTLLCSP